MAADTETVRRRATGTGSARSESRLFRFGVAITVTAVAWLLATTPVDDPLLVVAGVVILGLAVWPSLAWARRESRKLPAFELLMLTGVNFYAMPLLRGHPKVIALGVDVALRTAGLIITFQLAALAAYHWTRGRHAQPGLLTRRLISERSNGFLCAAIAAGGLFSFVSSFTTWNPGELLGVLRAVFFGGSTVASFVLARLWGFERLESAHKRWFIAALTLYVLCLFPSLYLVSAISVIGVSVIGYVSASHRLPWLLVAVITPFFVLLNFGKPEMREVYWQEGGVRLKVSEYPAFMAAWLGNGIEAVRTGTEGSGRERPGLLERASLFQMIGMSVSRVPSELPHLEGISYVDIPAQLVPRFIWPNKPSPHLSNERLAIYFGLVNEDNTSSVSIAFGMPAEAYVNFGWYGVIALGAAFGSLYKRVVVLAQQATILSPVGLGVVLLTAWSFQVELVVASWLSSLIQAAAVVIGVPLAIAWARGHGAPVRG